jgi:PAS domain S-box-containing protein
MRRCDAMRDQTSTAGFDGTPDEAVMDGLRGAISEEYRHLQTELDLRNCALDSASSHFMILDVTASPWRIVYVNRAVAQDHGYEPAELLGQDPAILTPAADNKVALARLGKAVHKGASASAELVSRHRDGSTFSVGITLTPVRRTANTVSHYLAIGADITVKLEQERERRLLQERLYNEMQERERMGIELRLAQKLESVGRLAAGIAHEINTPIQYIGDSVSFLETAYETLEQIRVAYLTVLEQLDAGAAAPALWKDIKATEEAADLPFLRQEIPRALERTQEGVERVAAIVRAMKEFAHPDSAEQNPADLNRALETTLLVTHNEYKYCAQVETQLGALPEVICNMGELSQVFLNLIVNAAHTISESGQDVRTGRIIIATAAVGEHVEISITDNGCGIAPENLDRIFDPFFTTKPVGRGTGQGLAIARAIVVEKHGGSINVHSKVGSGTQFVVQLPVAGRRLGRAP